MEEKLLLSPEVFKPTFKDWKIEGIFNPATIRRKDKKIVLFVRIAERPININELEFPVAINKKKYEINIESIKENEFLKKDGNMVLLKNGNYRLSNISHFRKVILKSDGFTIEEIDQKPAFFPNENYEEFGVEDPRIVKIGNKYLMTYVSVSLNNGITTSLASSENLNIWKKRGIIFAHENKDVVIFPEKISGEYVLLNRPVGNFNFSNPSVWISYSMDLTYIGKNKCLFKTRENSWDCDRIGAGCPPIKTNKGWLLIYHGVSGKIYCAGAVLLDLKNPEKVIARTSIHKPLFSPDNKYERVGYVNNVVFPTGIVLDLDHKHLLIYSGAADQVITVKRIKIEDILNSLDYF